MGTSYGNRTELGGKFMRSTQPSSVLIDKLLWLDFWFFRLLLLFAGNCIYSISTSANYVKKEKEKD